MLRWKQVNMETTDRFAVPNSPPGPFLREMRNDCALREPLLVRAWVAKPFWPVEYVTKFRP